VFVALGIKHAMSLRYIFICGVSGCTTVFYIILLKKATIFEGKVTEHKMCVLIFSTTFV